MLFPNQVAQNKRKNILLKDHSRDLLVERLPSCPILDCPCHNIGLGTQHHDRETPVLIETGIQRLLEKPKIIYSQPHLSMTRLRKPS